ncbi:MAG: anti-sigma regulatory factor [Firmicutes bacterium]|nr:anti-sigma regulatory factor [Bacillota bacterium]
MSKSIQLHFELPGNDLALAGEASSKVKKTLNQLGLKPAVVKKTAVAMYEAEINAIIHAGGGTLAATIDQEKVVVVVRDQGPGIADLELAMQEGYSTAPEKIREMGFGAGMGLPNMKRHADLLEIESAVGQGTVVTIIVYL